MQKRPTYKYQRIRDIREDKDLTQQSIADFLNLYLNQYRRYENGETTIPVNILKKLSKFYKVSMDYLTEIEEEIKH
ncbi:helix-turn-helix domain-containing protein [uncultured Eubacterium sp.]|uniref:helix-turn-helix domain-containing protein n=1 Tax=uncultured Eubacterium sp. TaxID=165185 RepID=UPI00258989A2|nr:helix-turn-helix transcriptional regulator [uncultured Eubacterium sp.]